MGKKKTETRLELEKVILWLVTAALYAVHTGLNLVWARYWMAAIGVVGSAGCLGMAIRASVKYGQCRAYDEIRDAIEAIARERIREEDARADEMAAHPRRAKQREDRRHVCPRCACRISIPVGDKHRCALCGEIYDQ